MKVGILTYHDTNNFGAMLQSYALYKVINDLGVECEIINYFNDYMRTKLSKQFIPAKITFKNVINYFMRYPFIRRRKSNFNKFKENFLNIKEKPFSDSQYLINATKKYDRIVTGSDQVWNYIINDNDYHYYLDFCEKGKKAAYAPSFGISKIDDDKKDIIKKLLKDFGFLSVRDRQGQKIIEELLGISPFLALDPTLLLNKNQWEEVIKGKSVLKRDYGQYILVYNMGTSSLYDFAKRLAEKTGLNLVIIDGSVKNLFKKNIYSALGLGPLEWVDLFLNASIVCTNSFHGTAFSINFNKQFYTELIPPPFKYNSRLFDILEMFGLKDRLIQSDKTIKENDIVDFSNANVILQREREKSLAFLESIIHEN